MKWTEEAEKAVSRVPFFVRKRVRRKVEVEAQRRDSKLVTLEHVMDCQKKFLKSMADEVKGYQVETCFGPGGCPNRAVKDDDLPNELEKLLQDKNLRDFLLGRVKGPLKMHHEFRISISDCPNACSRPQIADLGLIGAVTPRVSEETCTRCGACQDVCKESAIEFSSDSVSPTINRERCVSCGQCILACSTGTLVEGKSGRRVLLGGKLGRHPQLALELAGTYSRNEALKIVRKCLRHYMENCTEGERFAEILNRTGMGFLAEGTLADPGRS
jgi:anaerobic sulfite reductase subunit C